MVANYANAYPKFEFWANNNKDVLLLGKSGVGKSAILRESLEKLGYVFGDTVAYYSPHSGDFIGDPTKAKVILFDNLNDLQAQRAADEILNLKLWKGVPVAGCVWGAFTILTSFDYDEKEKKIVLNEEKCPSKLEASFEVKVGVPYTPNIEYLKEHFEERLVVGAIEWWEQLGDEAKELVSPRALTNALVIYKQRGDMRDVLPVMSNVSKLSMLLNMGPITMKLEQLLNDKDDEDTRRFLLNENNLHSAMKYIPKEQNLMEYFVPLMPKEKIFALLWDDKSYDRNVIFDFVINSIIKDSPSKTYFIKILKEILQNPDCSPRLSKKIRRAMVENQELSLKVSDENNPS